LNAREPNAVRATWPQTHRIIRQRFPPVDLFEDIADPADRDAILSAEAKTNPRVAESVGRLDLVPEERRIAGVGGSRAMAPSLTRLPTVRAVSAMVPSALAAPETASRSRASRRCTIMLPTWLRRMRRRVGHRISASLWDLWMPRFMT